MWAELLEIKEENEAGYHPLVWFEGWRAAFLNDTPLFHEENIREMQRHNTSDEVFLLLEGSITLYVADGTRNQLGHVTAVELERGKMYNVRKGVWHTHVTGPGAKAAIIENADVSKENTDTIPFSLSERKKESDTEGSLRP